MIRTARDRNSYKTENEALKFENKHACKAKVACLGLVFKPNIDDLRESPALFITQRLIVDVLKVLVVESNIDSFEEFEIVEYNKAIEDADVNVFLVGYRKFCFLEILDKKIIDFCGITN